MLRTFAQRRKSTQSTSKLSFKKESSDLDELSNQLSKIQKNKGTKDVVKNNNSSLLLQQRKSTPKLEHIKSSADLSMDWSTVNTQIKEQDQQDIYMSLKTQYPKSSIINKKVNFNPKGSFVMSNKKIQQEPLKKFNKQPTQPIKKQTVIKSALVTPKQIKIQQKNNLNANLKATQMISKRQKDKITVRLKGLIQLVHCTQIAADNLPEILAIIDKLGEKIKKS